MQTRIQGREAGNEQICLPLTVPGEKIIPCRLPGLAPDGIFGIRQRYLHWAGVRISGS
jgi:hypothetical protein